MFYSLSIIKRKPETHVIRMFMGESIQYELSSSTPVLWSLYVWKQAQTMGNKKN